MICTIVIVPGLHDFLKQLEQLPSSRTSTKLQSAGEYCNHGAQWLTIPVPMSGLSLLGHSKAASLQWIPSELFLDWTASIPKDGRLISCCFGLSWVSDSKETFSIEDKECRKSICLLRGTTMFFDNPSILPSLAEQDTALPLVAAMLVFLSSCIDWVCKLTALTALAIETSFSLSLDAWILGVAKWST